MAKQKESQIALVAKWLLRLLYISIREIIGVDPLFESGRELIFLSRIAIFPDQSEPFAHHRRWVYPSKPLHLWLAGELVTRVHPFPNCVSSFSTLLSARSRQRWTCGKRYVRLLRIFYLSWPGSYGSDDISRSCSGMQSVVYIDLYEGFPGNNVCLPVKKRFKIRLCCCISYFGDQTYHNS